MTYLNLFWSFFQIGLFSIGGGYASMPLIQHQIVEHHNWLSLEEFADTVTIAEMTPGPIAVNAATFVGTRLGGPIGAILATMGCILPSCILVTLFAVLYTRYKQARWIQGVLGGLRPAIVGLIAASGWTILLQAFRNGIPLKAGIRGWDPLAILLFATSFFLLRKVKINPVFLLLSTGAAGAVLYWAAGGSA